MLDDALGRASHEELSQFRMAPRTHHDHIGITLPRELGDYLCRVSAFDDHFDSKTLRPQGFDRGFRRARCELVRVGNQER